MIDMYGTELRVGDTVQSRLSVAYCPREQPCNSPVCTILSSTVDKVVLDCHLDDGSYRRFQMKPEFLSKCYERVDCES